MASKIILTALPTRLVHSTLGVDWHMLYVIHWPTVNHNAIVKTKLIKIANATSLFFDELFIG